MIQHLFAFGQCVACEFNNDLDSILQTVFCIVFALYFFGDCIARTATAQKGV